MEIIQAQQKTDELIKNYGGYWTELSMLAHLVEEVGELSKTMNLSSSTGPGGVVVSVQRVALVLLV
jgi:NTP pyrophosphatase (non-canonical NTP hydrolase)